ncbi:MAG: type II secretion system protein GspN [Thermodesulfobacteriota bacterium]
MSRKKRWFGYILYCFLVTAGFLYLLFPSEVLKEHLIHTANAQNSPMVVSINRLALWPTLGLKLDEAKVSLKNRSTHTLFQADRLIVRPKIWSFLKGNGRYCFSCQAYGGELQGSMQFDQKNPSSPLQTEMELHDIRLGAHTYLEEVAGRRIQGNLSGILSYSGPTNNFFSGNGKANLALLDGTIELLFPILQLDSLAFNEIVVDMVLRNRVITIARCELRSSQLDGNLSGDIRLRTQIERSSINLRGELKPFASFFTGTEGSSIAMGVLEKRLKRGALRFVVRGTLSRPKINFI